MSQYCHLPISERESIWESVIKWKPLRQIARETGRSISTISRELKRNGHTQSYRPLDAQDAYKKRRQCCKRHRILTDEELSDTVAKLIIKEQWYKQLSVQSL